MGSSASTARLHALVDILKVLRSQAMTQAQIGEHAGLSPMTVSAWVRQLVNSGLLVEDAGADDALVRRSKFGRAPVAYRLSQAWIGKLSEGQTNG